MSKIKNASEYTLNSSRTSSSSCYSSSEDDEENTYNNSQNSENKLSSYSNFQTTPEYCKKAGKFILFIMSVLILFLVYPYLIF